MKKSTLFIFVLCFSTSKQILANNFMPQTLSNYTCAIGQHCSTILKPNTVSKWEITQLLKNSRYHCIIRGFPKIGWVDAIEASEDGVDYEYKNSFPEGMLIIETDKLTDNKHHQHLKLHFVYHTSTDVPAEVSLICAN